MSNVEPKVALITGATSGIGRAAAIGFAAKGYRVAALGRRGDELDVLGREHGFAFWQSCDVSRPVEVARYFERLAAELGRLDVVFNNAGRSAPAVDFGDVRVEDWDAVLGVNITGAFHVAQAAYRMMRDQRPQGGRIINNGSISAHVPRPYSAAYAASKHAVTGLTKSISLDGRAHNIACSQIDIGNAGTDMTSGMLSGVRQANGSTAPEPTFDVQHAVDAVLFMAGLPAETNVQSITIMATTMPYIGRG